MYGVLTVLTTPELAAMPREGSERLSPDSLGSPSLVHMGGRGRFGVGQLLVRERSSVRLSLAGGWRCWLSGIRVGPLAVAAGFSLGSTLAVPAASLAVPDAALARAEVFWCGWVGTPRAAFVRGVGDAALSGTISASITAFALSPISFSTVMGPGKGLVRTGAVGGDSLVPAVDVDTVDRNTGLEVLRFISLYTTWLKLLILT